MLAPYHAGLGPHSTRWPCQKPVLVLTSAVKYVVFGCLLLASSSVFAQRYSISHSAEHFAGRALNDSNLVGGQNRIWPSAYAALDYPTAMLNLSVDSTPASSSTILDLNDRGQAVGFFSVFDPGTFTAYPVATLFTASERTALGTTPDMRESVAYGINDWGWVVGQNSNNRMPTGPESQAFVWVSGYGMFPLPCNGGELRAAAKAVTNAGWIGGSCGHNPYLWANGVGYDISSWMPEYVDLGHGLESRASIAANLYCEVNSIAENHAFSVYCYHERGRAREHLSFVSSAAMRGLVQTPRFTKINAINRSGCAVGSAPGNSPRTGDVAIKYCDGVLTDLNDVVSSPDILREAADINDYGAILVWREDATNHGIYTSLLHR